MHLRVRKWLSLLKSSSIFTFLKSCLRYHCQTLRSPRIFLRCYVPPVRRSVPQSRRLCFASCTDRTICARQNGVKFKFYFKFCCFIHFFVQFSTEKFLTILLAQTLGGFSAFRLANSLWYYSLSYSMDHQQFYENLPCALAYKVIYFNSFLNF